MCSTIIIFEQHTTLAQRLFAGGGSFGSQYLRVHASTPSAPHVHLLQPSKYDSTPDLQVTHGVRVGDGDGDLGGHSFFVQPARLPFLHVHVLL